MTDLPIVEDMEEGLLAPPDPNLICPICLKLLTRPSRTPCGHIFCAQCLQEWLPQKTQCPECRSPVRQSDVTTDRFAERLVANLQGFCQFRKQGCQWVGARGDMSGHCARECQFVTVCCPNTGCDKELLRRDLWKHSEHECAYSCQACEVELECPFGCGHACVEGELEPHKEQCLMEPRKLLAALKHLHLENQRLSAENENLRDEVSSCPPSPRTQRKASRRRTGPGTCID